MTRITKLICAVDIGLTTGVGAAQIHIDSFIDYKYIDSFEFYHEMELPEVRIGRFIRFAKRHEFDEYIIEWPKRDIRRGANAALIDEIQLWERIFNHEIFEDKVLSVTPGEWKSSAAGIWSMEDALPAERLPGGVLALSKHERDALRIIYWRARRLRLKLNE